MLDAILNQIQGLTPVARDETLDNGGLDEENQSTVTTLGIANATERHINEYEENYDAKIQKATFILDLSLTVTTNSIYSLFLLYAIDGISSTFSPLPYHILSAAFNTALGTTSLATKTIKIQYVVGLNIARIALTSTINGVLLSKIDEKVKASKDAEIAIVEQIKQYEGYKEPPQSPNFGFLFSTIALGTATLGIISRVLLKISTRGSEIIQ